MATTEAPVVRDDHRLSVWGGMARQYDYFATMYRRTWKSSVISSFVAPLFYVLAMGVLLGGFVHVAPSQLEGATSYLAFVVPGLIAAQSMQTAVSETTYPVMAAIKWHKSFWAQMASPLEVRDLANAMLMFTLFRVGSTCGVYFLVMAPFGVFATWWGPILAWAVTLLTGMVFAVWAFAFSAHIRSEASFGLMFRLGLIPRHVWLQPGEHLKTAGAALGEALGRVAHREWNPDVGTVAETTKTRRHSAHDGVRTSVEHKCATDNLRIAAKLTMPERIGQHHHRRLLRNEILVGGKGTAGGGIGAKQRKV